MSFTFWIFIYVLAVFCLTYSLDIRRKKQFFLVLVLPVLIYVHTFVDVNTVADLPAYNKSFHDVASVNVFNPIDIHRYLRLHKEEYGFICMLKIVRFITDDFHVFLCLNSCILLGLYSYSILKYSDDAYISVLLLLLVVFDQSLFVLRQHLSISILWLSIPYIINRKIVPFVVILSIAFLFHKSSLIWFVVYFMYGAEKSWKIIGILGCATIVMSLIFSNLSYLNETFSLGYASYIDGRRMGTSNYVGFFLGLFFLLSYCYICWKNLWENSIVKLCFISLFIWTLMSFVGINILILSRFTLVFRSSLFFAVPIIFYSIKSQNLRFLYLGISLVLFAYSNYFGSFSDYVKNTELFMVNPMQMCYFFLLVLGTIYLLFHYTQEEGVQLQEKY